MKKIQSEKTKLDIPIVAGIENIFLNYNIAPAAYHGGKLDGVDCQEVLRVAHSLFADIKNYLLPISHPDRCINEVLISICDLHADISITFN